MQTRIIKHEPLFVVQMRVNKKLQYQVFDEECVYYGLGHKPGGDGKRSIRSPIVGICTMLNVRGCPIAYKVCYTPPNESQTSRNFSASAWGGLLNAFRAAYHFHLEKNGHAKTKSSSR